MKRCVLVLVAVSLVLGLASFAWAQANADPSATGTVTTFTCVARPCSFSANVTSVNTWPRDISWITWILPNLVSGTLNVRYLDCCIVAGDQVGGAIVAVEFTLICVGPPGAGAVYSECTNIIPYSTSFANAVLLGFAHVQAGGGLPAGATISGTY